MSYHLARDLGVNDTVVWLSTPASDVSALTRMDLEAERRTLRAALGHGRASAEYAAAKGDQDDADAALALAVSRVDPAVSGIVQDVVLKIDSEYVTVRFAGDDAIEVGRAGYGTSRAAHSAGTPVFPVVLRVTATFDVELIVEGSPISPGEKGDVTMAEPGRISAVKLLGDVDGDVVVDVQKAAFADLPAGPFVSIVGASFPTLSSAQTYVDTTLTGWDLQYEADDVLRFIVSSSSGLSRVTVALTCTTAV